MDSSSEAARRTIAAFIIVRIISFSYPEVVNALCIPSRPPNETVSYVIGG